MRLKPFVYQEMSVKLCPLTWSGNDLPRYFCVCRMNGHGPLFCSIRARMVYRMPLYSILWILRPNKKLSNA